MEKQLSPRFFWKILELNITEENQIIQIDESLSQTIEQLVSVAIHCVPSETLSQNIHDVGELSLSINSAADHLLNMDTYYTPLLHDDSAPRLILMRTLTKARQIKGYYRDHARMRNSRNEFVPYTLKIMFDCSTTL